MRGLRDPRRLLGLTALALVVSAVVLGGFLLVLLAEDRVSQATVWRTRLAVLIGLEVAYAVVLAITLAATPVLCWLFVNARRRRIARPAVARWLLTCVVLLLSLGLAEGAAGFWRARLERAGILALAETPRAGESENRPGLPGAPADIRLPTEFPDPPDSDATIVVIGESSAEGVPFNLFGISVGTLVTWQLGELMPGRRFQLVNLAFSGENLERQHQKLAKLERRPDVLIVYCGHNEFSARIPWSRELPHYADDATPPISQKLVASVERTSRLCGLIRQAADTCRIAIPPPLGGYRTLVDSPAYAPAEYALLLTDFQARLEQIVAYAESVGALPILIIPPANDSSVEPNRSYLPPETPRTERNAFAREFHAARRLEISNRSAAVERYRALLERQPRFAEAHFRLSRLLELGESWQAAYQHAVAARDCDGMPIRCPSVFQDAYRTVSARHRTILIDGQAYFHAIGRHGLLDDQLFMDAMHPSLRGQIALAQAVLQGLRARRAFGWPEATSAPVIEPSRCAAHFGLGPKAWEKLCLWNAMVYDLISSGPHDPSHRVSRREAYQSAFVAISEGAPPESVGLPNVGTPDPVPPYAKAIIVTEPLADAVGAPIEPLGLEPSSSNSHRQQTPCFEGSM